MLQDARVDPAARNNLAIRWASRHGRVAVVDRLLKDLRVDPAAQDNYSIIKASINGHIEVVERLLQVLRIDRVVKHKAVRSALSYGDIAIAEFLQKHRCCDPVK